MGGGAYANLPGLPLRTGYTYTLSAWVFIASGPVVTMMCNGSTANSTSTTGSWQRIVLTFTCGDGSTDLWFWPAASTTSGQIVYVDDIQLEYAGSASAFTTTGPTIHPVFTGFIERYPNTWQYAGFQGLCKLQCVDAIGMIPRVNLDYSYYMDVAVDLPTYWWPFDDNNAQAGNPTITQRGTATDLRGFNGGSASSGTADSSAQSSGKNDGVGADNLSTLYIQAAWSSPNAPPATPDVGACVYASWAGTKIGGSAAGFTVEFWFRAFNVGWTQHMVSLRGTNLSDGNDEYQFIYNSSGLLVYRYLNTGGSIVETTTSSSLTTGFWYHCALATSSSGGTITSLLYLNGSLIGTMTRSASTVPVRNQLIIGSGSDGTGGGAGLPGTGYYPFDGEICNLCVYQNTIVPQSRLQVHYTSGNTGYSGETTGTRINRLLAWAKWKGPSSISNADGIAIGTARGANGVTLADYLKTTLDTEQGLVYADPAGILTFFSQADILARSNVATFGENTGSGEIPYVGDKVQFELEPSEVFNDILVTPYKLPNPDTYVRDIEIFDNTSIQEYGYRQLQLDALVQTGPTGLTQENTLATFLLNQHKEPRQMVTGVSVALGANPSAWARVLPRRIGDLVTLNRRTAVGGIFSVQGYIENIQWNETPQNGAIWQCDIEPIQV